MKPNTWTLVRFGALAALASGCLDLSDLGKQFADGGDGGGVDAGGPSTCLGVVCDQPPAPTCPSATAVQTWSATGTCDTASGKCGYLPNVASCDAGQQCLQGACVTPADSGCAAQCQGNNLVDCAGHLTACALGCNASAQRCNRLVPSNGAQATGANGALTIPDGGSGTINSDTGEVDVGGAVVRAAGFGAVGGIGFIGTTGANVLEVASVRVGVGATLRIRGSNPLVLLSDGDVTVEGLIDISAGCPGGGTSCGGPGGGAGSPSTSGQAVGVGAGGNGAVDMDCSGDGMATGGGGGGYGTAGAAGGALLNHGCDTDPDLNGGAAGAVAGGASLVPLLGGSGGGASGSPGTQADFPAIGGGGGGALQITSLTQLTFGPGTGAGIHAGGGGGQGNGAGSDGTAVYAAGGAGGGSGGAILLEAPAVTLGAGVLLAANGGAGGSGDSSADGAPGAFSATLAAIGGCDIAAGCSEPGGNGGVGATAPTPGIQASTDQATSGGGGAVGRIRLSAAQVSTTGALFSPAPSTGAPAVR